jgi:hypothetical protein
MSDAFYCHGISVGIEGCLDCLGDVQALDSTRIVAVVYIEDVSSVVVCVLYEGYGIYRM